MVIISVVFGVIMLDLLALAAIKYRIENGKLTREFRAFVPLSAVFLLAAWFVDPLVGIFAIFAFILAAVALLFYMAHIDALVHKLTELQKTYPAADMKNAKLAIYADRRKRPLMKNSSRLK